MGYAQKSFGPFLKSRRLASYSLHEPRGTNATHRLLELLAREGSSQVGTLFHRSKVDPIPFAEALQNLSQAGLIETSDGDELVSLTSLGRKIASE